MKNAFWIVVGLVAVLVAGTVVYQLSRPEPVAEPVAASSQESPPPPAPAAASPAPPAIAHPLPETAPGPSTAANEPLPALSDSDAAARNAIVALVGPQVFAALFHPDDLIRRLVATIDNLPREKAFVRLLPVVPVTGHFEVVRDGEALVLGANNAARYSGYLKMAEAIDPKALAAVYIRFYPLLQQQYKALGYPDRYFNDRVIETIDDLLAAPSPAQPVKLVQPKVLYQFEDPDLERRSAGQKAMIRMGAQNADRIKARLRLIRAELASPQAAARQPGSSAAGR